MSIDLGALETEGARLANRRRRSHSASMCALRRFRWLTLRRYQPSGRKTVRAPDQYRRFDRAQQRRVGQRLVLGCGWCRQRKRSRTGSTGSPYDRGYQKSESPGPTIGSRGFRPEVSHANDENHETRERTRGDLSLRSGSRVGKFLQQLPEEVKETIADRTGTGSYGTGLDWIGPAVADRKGDANIPRPV